MRLLDVILSMIARRSTLTQARRELRLQAFARSLERQHEGELLDLLAALPRRDTEIACPEAATKRTLVLTRLHRLTMEADATSLPAGLAA